MFESIIGFIAPHLCYGCGLEGDLLCVDCKLERVLPVPERCYQCMKLSRDAAVCKDCRRKVYLRNVWVRTSYDGAAKDLVRGLKFERVRGAALPIAELMCEVLPYGIPIDMVVPLPTATVRMRRRGYDQATLLAKRIARQRSLPCVPALSRLGSTRQVGANRATRLKQLQGMFYCTRPDRVRGRSILLIDDVLTTGASIEQAAEVLRQAGAASVSAVVFAHKQ